MNENEDFEIDDLSVINKDGKKYFENS